MRNRFDLGFETENAAFAADFLGEIDRILRGVAERVNAGGDNSGVIQDSNGNSIGQWDYDPPENDEED
jgi:hypothetical protein